MTINKKYLYIMLGATVALTSCSNDDEVKVPSLDRTISFGSYVGRPSARGLVTDISGLEASAEGFGVFANHDDASDYASSSKIPNFMYNQQVVHSGIGWTYSPLKYWPSSASEKISFFAYAPYIHVGIGSDLVKTGTTGLTGPRDSGDPYLSFSVGSDITQHKDLLYASAVDQVNMIGAVPLEFKHALCRVGFRLTGWEDVNGEMIYDDNTTVTVNAITFASKRKGATLNMRTGEWSNPTERESFAYTLGGDLLQNNVVKPSSIQGQQLNTENGYMMILPDLSEDGQSERYCILVDYTVETLDPALKDGKTVKRNKIYRYIQPGFEQGKAYMVNIRLGLSGKDIGGGDDTVTEDDPQPVDPNPENPVQPSQPGKGGYVQFSTTIEDWTMGEIVNVPLTPAAPSTPGAPEATFAASQINLHINGSFTYANPDEAPSKSVTLQSIIKEGTDVNILKREQAFTTGAYSIATSNLNLGLMEPNVKYILTLRNTDGDLYTTDLIMDFGVMQMTVDFPAAVTTFIMPLKTGTTPSKLAFVWGDESQSGEISSLSSTNRQYTFQSSGLKEIKILSAVSMSSNKVQIPEFSMASYSSACKEFLVSMDTPILRSNNTGFSCTFENCTNLRSIHPELFRYNPDVTSFFLTFSRCTSLESIPAGLFDYNTQATKLQDVFSGCSSIESIPQGLFDKCTNVENLSSVFSGCTKITEVPTDLFKYNTNVKDLGGVFANTSITSIPATLFATNTKVTNFTSTFFGTKISSIPAGLFDNCPELYELQNCFHGCENLTSVPAELFKNNSKVYYFSSLFWNCTALRSVPADIFKNCTAANTMSSIFFGCTALESIPEDLFADCVNMVTIDSAFSGCTTLSAIPAGLLRNNPKVYGIGHAFENCTNLKTVPKTIFDSLENIQSALDTFKGCSAITSEVPELWNRTVNKYTQCYYGVTNAANYADIPAAWK